MHNDAVGYDIELVDSDSLSRAMSMVKWSTAGPSSSTRVDLMQGPGADLLFLAMKNLPSFIAMEPLLSFLKDTYYGGGSACSHAKSDLIDDVDADKVILSVTSKGKEPIRDIKRAPCTYAAGKDPHVNPFCVWGNDIYS
ncbi:hypothetical protein D1007_19284 [Hordeum vulgare]|nr:hypothetical protein D1007_19284 [Hordeum vulgare]